jgi:single-stranded DNA-binding protein
MMSIEAALFGSITRDAEVKTSQAGKQYLRLNVRVEAGDKVLFVNTMVFDAEAIAGVDKLKAGARVYIEGRLSLDTWTGQDGAQRHGLSATSWHCRLSQIGRAKSKSDKPASAPASGREVAARSDYAPAGKAPAFDDDLPF